MNKRKVAKRKGSKVKANNDPSEVFVLPPNLLEALGINLGNIETVPESTSGNQISDKDLTYKEKSTNQGTPSNLSETNSTTSSEKELSITKSAENDLLFEKKVTDQGTHVNIPENSCTTFLEQETSIIQKANLMKESVFLSPTFISNNKCIIGGEVEIVGNAEIVHETVSELNAGPEKYVHDQSDQYQEDFSVTNLENPSDTQSSVATQESNRDVQSTDNVQINSISKDINYDDHADEAYSSDGSNGNIELNNKSDDSNSSVLLPINNSKKICIISEQILDPSKFKALQSSYSADKSSLIPVTMNTVLKSNIWNNDCDPNIVTCHVAPSVTIDSNLRDQTEQNLECEYVTDLLMKNDSLKESDYANQTAAICDSLNNYLNLDILSNVSEDIVIDTQIQEEPSQHAFKAQNSEFDTHLVLPDTLNRDKKGNIMEKNISDTKYTNTSVIIYEKGKVNETLQTVDPKAYDIQNYYVYRNPLSSVSEDVIIDTQILKGTFDNAFELHKSEFDVQFELGHSFNRMKSNNTMETNISDTKNTNTIIKNVEERKVSEAFEKNSAKSFDEQNLCLNSNLEFEGVANNTKKDQNDLSQNALEVPKGEFDTRLLLPNTLHREDSGNMIKTIFSNTTKTQQVVSEYEELKINEKVNLTAVDEQNFHIDDKHQELSTKLTPKEINTKLDNNIRKTSHDVVKHSKRKSDVLCGKDSKIERVCEDNLAQNPNSNESRSETNVKKQKLNDKVKHTQAITKGLKRTRHNNSNMQSREMLVDAHTKPTQKIQKKLQDCSVIDNNMKIIQCNNISFSTSKADHSAQLCRLGINNDVQEDRIREIAGYLSKFAELQKRNKIIKERQNIRGIKICTNKKHATNTKLSIQGVEKPGGSEEGMNPKNDENIKTYERKRKYKPPVKVPLKKCNYETLNQKINLPVNESCYTCNDTDLCHCDDFGRLIHYDDESMHEHIHFWNRKGIDCTPDLIFGIYNEKFPANICNDDTKSLQDHPYIPIEKSSTPDRKICWNEINSSDSEVFDKERSEYIVNSCHESVENTLLKIDKLIESSVGEQIKPDGSKCSGRQVKNTENWHKKAMESVSQLESDQETMNNIIVPDLNPMKNRKKRKFSSPFNESDKSVHQHAADSQLARAKSDKIVKKQKCLETGHTEEIISSDKLDFQGGIAISLSEVTSTVCGVCRQNIKDTDWLNHIASQHNYLSWRDDEQPLDLNNRQLLILHLATLIKQYGVLSCSKCGTTRKYAKPFLQHINQCTAVEEYHSESALTSSFDFGSKADPTSVKPVTLVECGVCGESFLDNYWHSHIGSQHNYLAWKCGEQPLDVDDEDKVKEHLYNITKEHGGLKCAKCGLVRKYVKSYQTHIKSCDGQSINESLNDSSSKGSLHIVSEVEPVRYVSDSVKNVSIENGIQLATDDLTKCGACGEFMHDKDWYRHIGSQHNYLAWKHGEQSLDVDDGVAVKEHLLNVMKECGELKCAKCGLSRKYVKSYQTHIRNCDERVSVSESISGSEVNYSLHVSEIEPCQRVSDLISNINIENEMDTTTDFIQCAVCGDSMHNNDWYDHIGLQHNYFAWRCGEPTLDFVDEEATYKHLYAITKQYGGLKCVKCGLIRKYVKSYLTHVKNCTGLSDSQTENVFNDLLNVSEAEPAKIMNNLRSENDVNNILLKCGVCEQIVQNINWYSHIRSEHNYLAWKYGEPALDVDQEEAVREHLNNITKQYGRLDCTKCGVTKKYVRGYLAHVKNCGGLSVKTKDDNPIADDAAPNIVVLSEAEQHTGLIKCGVCGQYMPLPDWPAHIEAKHNYLAWKDGETSLDVNNKAEVRQHLKNIVKELGKLVCMKCGVERKFTKSYLRHIEKCDGSTEDANNSNVTDEVIWPSVGDDQVKCGVCDELVQAPQWIKHIAEQHDYLAKKVGETPLDVDDEEQVYKHLYNIVKENGGIACQKCGKERKYVKSYLEHIRKCGQDLSVTGDTTFEANAASSLDTSESLIDFYRGGTCGVCEKEIETGKWIQHIQKEHNYLAWRKGEKPWNLDDFTEVNDYLYEITKKMNGLTCNKCGLVRKYVKSYLTHIKSCNVVDFNLSSIVPDGVGPVSDKAYRCAICQKEIEPSNWKDHAMKEHYNITWIIGETPIDIKNPYAVEKYLKEYKQYYSLKCNACGATRASFAGFYAHIITCGKSEEQIEMFQSVCDICNNKYLCIYKNQHMMIHKVQSYSKELKMSKQSNGESDLSGKRQAAQKARSVLETYCSDMSQHSHKCSTCGFGTDFKEEMDSHKCNQNEKDFSADEGSAVEGEGSEDESIDSEVDSDISREEAEDQEQSLKRKRVKEPAGSKLSKIHFKVEDPNAFLEKCDVDFCNAFYTDDTLFSKWLSCERETVSENDLPKYLPPMEQSCKVKAGFDWTTLKRFEAKNGDGTSLFVGACIVCVAWVPLRVEDITGDSQNFLAIACHNDVDCPRYKCDETPQHECLIQIWDFGTCKELPRIVYGIAHDFGTVWSMDWCPSGARDVLPEDLADGQPYRLGLLAVACSNGSAYIFSVPHPASVVKNNHFIQKLKPVAELRMKMFETSDRVVYQATSITWCKQKGHEIILVGYADGTTGYFDVNNESPLSRKIENDVEIFFPYDEQRPHNTCITATDMYPYSEGGFAACSASATGAEMCIPSLRARVRSQLPARAAMFTPHWPSTLLAGDVAIMSTAVNELEWCGGARKLGGVRALAGCWRCGRVCGAAPPALRLMRPHPVYPEFRKPIIGMIEMVPLAKKRNKQVNDELAMKIEPLTYLDAISKYGIQFQSVSKRDKVLQQQCGSKPKVHCPERFPLADVESMAFCLTKRHHDKLAVATHSGIVFFTDVNS